MSEIIDMRAFAADKVKPVSDGLQGQLDLALRLALSVLLPPRIRNARTADARDIELRQQRIMLALEAITDFINAAMAELNENLPLDNTIPTADFFGGLADLKSDLTFLMERAADQE